MSSSGENPQQARPLDVIPDFDSLGRDFLSFLITSETTGSEVVSTLTQLIPNPEELNAQLLRLIGWAIVTQEQTGIGVLPMSIVSNSGVWEIALQNIDALNNLQQRLSYECGGDRSEIHQIHKDILATLVDRGLFGRVSVWISPSQQMH